MAARAAAPGGEGGVARVGVGKLLFGTEIRVEQTVQDGWLDVLPLSQFVSDPLR